MNKLLSPMGNIYWKDLEYRYLGCNKNQCDILKVPSPAEIIGKTDFELELPIKILGKKGIKAIRENDKKVVLLGKTRIFDEIGFDEKRNIVPYLTKKYPIKDALGNIVGLMGVSVNLTQKKDRQRFRKSLFNDWVQSTSSNLLDTSFSSSAGFSIDELLKKTPNLIEFYKKIVTPNVIDSVFNEKELSSVESLLIEKQKKIEFLLALQNNLISQSVGNIYWKNCEYQYLGCNQNFADVANVGSPQNIVGKTDYEMFSHSMHKKQLDQIRSVDKSVVLEGKEVTIEEKAVGSGGEFAVYLTKKVPLKYNNTIIGLIGTSINITKQKEAEELAREKVIAEKMIQTLKALAGSLSHELRTPLAGIELIMQSSGATIQSLMHFQEDVLAGRDPWPVSQESIQELKSSLPKIKQQLKSAEIIIDLQLQSIHEKDIDTRLFAHHSMVNIVQSALDQYPFYETERPLVHFEEQSDFTFWGESHLMLNVLYNLIKNSLYFVKEAGKGEIFIRLTSDDNYNYLYFKDTAKGMSPEIAANIFEEFYTKTRNGTGLGLAFCQQVMESFKGNISCRSEKGKYAEFILSFPKADEVSTGTYSPMELKRTLS